MLWPDKLKNIHRLGFIDRVKCPRCKTPDAFTREVKYSNGEHDTMCHWCGMSKFRLVSDGRRRGPIMSKRGRNSGKVKTSK